MISLGDRMGRKTRQVPNQVPPFRHCGKPGTLLPEERSLLADRAHWYCRLRNRNIDDFVGVDEVGVNKSWHQRGNLPTNDGSGASHCRTRCIIGGMVSGAFTRSDWRNALRHFWALQREQDLQATTSEVTRTHRGQDVKSFGTIGSPVEGR